jgi:hypothetical protein
MPRTRKNHPPSPKAKVAVEAIKAHKTAAQIAQMSESTRPRSEAGRNWRWPAGHLRQRTRPNARAVRYRNIHAHQGYSAQISDQSIVLNWLISHRPLRSTMISSLTAHER